MANPTQQEVIRVITAKDEAVKATNYVDSIKLDMQLIEGTRYKFRLSEQQPQR